MSSCHVHRRTCQGFSAEGSVDAAVRYPPRGLRTRNTERSARSSKMSPVWISLRHWSSRRGYSRAAWVLRTYKSACFFPRHPSLTHFSILKGSSCVPCLLAFSRSRTLAFSRFCAVRCRIAVRRLRGFEVPSKNGSRHEQ